MREADSTHIVVDAPSSPWPAERLDRLREELETIRDIAFAHLPRVAVPDRPEAPALVLFVWLLPGALRNLRMALNTVSDAVAGVVPDGEFLDVVILNSAPELLLQVEDAGCLILEADPDERRRALAAATSADQPQPEQEPVRERARRWWWPF